MSFIGTLHEISFYGLLASGFGLVNGNFTVDMLKYAAFHPQSFPLFFMCYLFWASVLFLPIAIIGAISTKHKDCGEGLTFDSDNVVVIFFAHIGEELLGLFLSPFWLIVDLIRRRLTEEKVADYIVYFLLIAFIYIGLSGSHEWVSILNGFINTFKSKLA